MKATVKEPGLLLDFLLELMQTTKKKTCRQMLKFNGVKVDGVIVKRANFEVTPGQVIEVKRVNKTSANRARSTKDGFRVHYEDKTIIVVEKPAGLLSTSTDHEKNQTMHAQLNEYLQACEGGRAYTVHRLDRSVAGLMVFAKTLSAQTDLQIGWKHANKKYVALVEGLPEKPEGRIETWLEEISSYEVKVSNDASPKAKFSTTEYSTRKTFGNFSLLDINLLTGRRHQIRVHLAHIGCPIVGDPVYGSGARYTHDIRLFAYFLNFRHPGTGRMTTFKVPIPDWDASHRKKDHHRTQGSKEL